ncbi:hypothetical protein G6F43_011839 [Rhizopus delemar]|nr:hypothetical protein G6F43_011839 [Rhizopus delemar]
MQSVFANLPKRKYKPVDLKAFDEAISEGISRERNSSQNPNAMYQHDEFAGVGRGAGRGRDHYNQADRYGHSYTQGTPGFGRGRGQYNQADRAVSGGLFQKSANFNNTNRNYGQYNQGNQDDDSYMQDVETFD